MFPISCINTKTQTNIDFHGIVKKYRLNGQTPLKQVVKIKILVTGGAGFIGSNLVRMLHKKYDIVVLDALTYCGRRENLLDTRHEFVHGDIRDEKIVNSILKEDIDSIIHFAASTHVDRSIENPLEVLSVDVLGTATLLEAARKYDINRFVMISTDEIYGSIEKGSFSESDSLRPSSPYSASKAGADLTCQAYYKTYGLPIVVARPSNNFGEMQFPEKLIPRFTVLALQNTKLPLFGNGLQQREWLYVLDCIEAIDLIMQKGKIGEAYNISCGDNNEKTNLWIAEFILEVLKKPKSLIEFVKDRVGHDIRYSLDSSKIRKLGWNPKWELADALKKTILWYVNNPDFWSSYTKDRFVKSNL